MSVLFTSQQKPGAVSTSGRDRHHRTVELPFIIIYRPSDLCVGCGQPCHDQDFQFIGCFWEGTGKALAEAFPKELVAVVNGGGTVSDAFCRLAFDKMILLVQRLWVKP